jgi:hypothetical protein
MNEVDVMRVGCSQIFAELQRCLDPDGFHDRVLTARRHAKTVRRYR